MRFTARVDRRPAMPMTLDELLSKTAARVPDRIALRFGDRAWSYAELDDEAARLAAGLAAAGVRPGDRVAFFLPNCPELVVAYFGTFRAGAAALPLNARYQGAEVQYAVGDARPTLLIAHASLVPRLDRNALAALGVREFFRVGDPPAPGFRPFTELLHEPRDFAPSGVEETSPAVILYTSGTTAKPKGVIHTHATLDHTARHQVASQQLAEDDVNLASLGICYIAGFSGQLLTSVFLGGTLVLLPHFHADAVLDAIQTHRATRLQMGPSDLADLVYHPRFRTTDLSSLRCCLAGGAMVPLELQRHFREGAGFDLTEVCGMTEAYNYCLNPPFGRKKPGSIGLPSEGARLRLVDADGNEVPRGESGEILVQSDAVMIGYWNNPEATAAALEPGPDGLWLRTGDLARQDEDGYYWFVGRKKEIIIRGASNIAPGEIESVLDAHPAVKLCGVVGAPDPHDGQVPVAYVALKEGCSEPPGEEPLRAFAAARLAAYKVPVRIFFLSDLPLNATGKVDRKLLEQRVPADMAGR